MKRIKIEDWYDNLFYNITHLKGNIKYFFEFLKRWFSYYKVLRKAYDFDWESILKVERHQITRVRDTIIKRHNYEGWEHDVHWMNIALKLLDIIENGGGAKLLNKGLTFIPGKDGLYDVMYSPESKWIMPFYVNTRNAKRFMPIEREEIYEDKEHDPLLKDRLRENKAWYLYHKLKIYKMRNWWT